MGLFERWVVIEVSYYDDLRTREMGRYSTCLGHMTYRGAKRCKRKKEWEDTIKNRFRSEYRINRGSPQ